MNATKYTFDTVFTTDRDTLSEAARGRRKRSLTEVEIEKLCADAKAEGLRAGEVLALEAVADGARLAAAAVRDAISLMAREREALRGQAAGIAFALARKLAHTALDALPQSEVEIALRDAMHQAIGEPRIVLKASARVVEALAPRINDIAHEEGFEGRVQVAADPLLKRADCRIEWRGGGAERAEAAIEAALEELIARHFHKAACDGEGADHGHE